MELTSSVILAATDAASMLSLAGQALSIILAIIIGRCYVTDRNTIWFISFLGALGVFLCLVFVDGQGAFLAIFFAPMIYLFAVGGRSDLR